MEAGHSHGTSDVGVAHAKRPLKANYYVPEEIVKVMNTVTGIRAEYIDFRDANKSSGQTDYLFRGDWSKFLGRHFKPIPYLPGSKCTLPQQFKQPYKQSLLINHSTNINAHVVNGYTKCHSFQIYGNGTLIMNLYANSPPETEYRHEYIDPNSVQHVRRTVIKELFPSSNGTLDTVSLADLNEIFLPILPNKTLTPAKLASLALKRDGFVEPSRRAYYPQEIWKIVRDSSLAEIVTKDKNQQPKKRTKGTVKIIKIDRKIAKEPSVLSNQKSMLAFLTKKSGNELFSPTLTLNSSIATESKHEHEIIDQDLTGIAAAFSQESQDSVQTQLTFVDGVFDIAAVNMGFINEEHGPMMSQISDVFEWRWDRVKMQFPLAKR